MIFAIRWDLIIEFSLLFLVLSAAIAVSSILMIRKLRTVYKDLYRQQSKFDIELRKSCNLLSKIVDDQAFESFSKAVIKDLTFAEKKHLLEIVDQAFQSIDKEEPSNQYVIETYDNLHEIRRTLDSKILGYNQIIGYFPFSLYARILKMNKMPHYTHK